LADVSTGNGCWFDVSTGTVGSATAGFVGSISAIGNGWYRCSMTFTPSAGNQNYGIYIGNTTESTSFAGNGFSGLLVSSPQLEAGAFATSYIPTVAATATRSGEDARMTESNFSSWYNQTAGSFYSEAKFYGGGRFWHVTPIGFSGQDQWEGVQNTTQVEVFVYKNSTIQAQLVSNLAHNITRKVAGSYAINEVTACIDGGTVSTDTSAAVIIPTALILGGYQNSGILGSGGTIKKIAYYPVRLTNAELQGLTAA
jgi:hypothetical protein